MYLAFLISLLTLADSRVITSLFFNLASVILAKCHNETVKFSILPKEQAFLYLARSQFVISYLVDGMSMQGSYSAISYLYSIVVLWSDQSSHCMLEKASILALVSLCAVWHTRHDLLNISVHFPFFPRSCAA